MSFLTTQPDELAAAAGTLENVGSAMAVENAAAAIPTTTGVNPAAADEVSALQATLFVAYGTLYQQVSAEAEALHQMFVNTLGMSAGTYAATEAANASAAASPLSSNIVGVFNTGAGNWSSAASDLLGMANGGLLPKPSGGPGSAFVAGPASAAVQGAGSTSLAEAPMAVGAGGASSIGTLAATPNWAGLAAPVGGPAAGALQGAGWTAAASSPAPVTAMPGMPGLASTTRNAAGFGTPRYGVKPVVMPTPAVV
jgi:hypothetical protein